MYRNATHHLGLMMGLLVMLLMTAALVAGQAGASLHETARADAGYRDISPLAQPHGHVAGVDFPAWDLAIEVDPELSRRAVEAAAAVVRDVAELP